mmetsp:Transcript_49132/g.66969  ORF Transcript_49132/g.66969 Transcript_49132/m.66969 type:complete len:222 (-) Transcript_49132:139-804(-)
MSMAVNEPMEEAVSNNVLSGTTVEVDLESDPEELEARASEALARANEGDAFFESTSRIASEISTVTAYDVAGAMRTLSRKYKERCTSHLSESKEAIAKVDVRSGMDGFIQTTDVREISKGPLGILEGIFAGILIALFAVIFNTAKYAPPAIQQVNEKAIVPATRVTKEYGQRGAIFLNDRVIQPGIRQAGIMINQAKLKLNNKKDTEIKAVDNEAGLEADL